jgi:hypothetical protein
VIDFGVARAAERVQLTTTRGAAGTPAYMAPEQARDATQASPASDVFSLGATLVYAATGHPPYGGETVMDILVRLATEPPDLTGMPQELDALITACLERVPRDRPTDGAILGSLGSFSLPPGPGHSYLPESAMALIAEYQNRPVPTAGDTGRLEENDSTGDATDGSGERVEPEDATSGSHTALPGFHSLGGYGADRAGNGQAGNGRAGADPAGADRAAAEQAGAGRGPARRRLLPGPLDGTRPTRRRAWAAGAWAAVAIGLVGAGIGLGLALHSAGARAAGTGGTGGTDSGLGPVATPSACAAQSAGTTPELCLSQPHGDGDTVYVVYGTGYFPFTHVTVGLAGHGDSPVRPVTDLNGTFSYAIDQGHAFFKGAIPPGTYHVLVTASGEPTARATFLVNAAAQHPPPPGSGPPPA